MFRGKWNLSVSVKKEQLPNVRRGNKYSLHKIRHSQILTTRSAPILQKKKKLFKKIDSVLGQLASTLQFGVEHATTAHRPEGVYDPVDTLKTKDNMSYDPSPHGA